MKHEQIVRWRSEKIYSYAIGEANSGPLIFIMHGAGLQASSSTSEQLAKRFVRFGGRVVQFDFLGHGNSSGKVSDLTLQDRTEIATAVINAWAAVDQPVALVGFSMSGYTALRLTRLLKQPITAIGLLAPALYAAEAETVPFDESFTKILRTPDSWKNSLAFADAAAYQGRAFIYASTHDEVVPWEITQTLITSLRHRSANVRIQLDAEPDHKLAGWLGEHSEPAQQLFDYLTASTDKA